MVADGRYDACLVTRVVAVVLLLGLVIVACSPSPAPTGAPTAPRSTAGPTDAVVDPGADVVLRGGNVITMDDARPRAEAVAIRDGRIQAVGTDAEVEALAGAATLVIELGGLTVMPGFIDAHQHRLTDGSGVLGPEPGEVADIAIGEGWTTLGELYMDQARLDALRALDEAGRLRVRVNAYLPVNENSAEGNLLGDYFDAYLPGQMLSPHLRVAGLKVFTDFDNATIMLWGQAELDAFLLARYQAGWPIAIKTVSTRSLAMILKAMRAVRQLDARVSVEGTRLKHMLFATPEQIAEVANLGLVPVINLNNPGQIVGVEGIPELIAGEPAGSYVPWRSLFEAGVPAAGMSGSPSFYVDEPTGAPFGSPMHMTYQAVTRAGNLGVMSPPELLDQAIIAEDALRSLTISAARAGNEEADKGSLTPGKLADLVVLSADPLAVSAPAINDIRVLLTMIDGRIEWCAPDTAAMCAGASGVDATPGPAATGTPAPPDAAGVNVTASASLPAEPPQHAVDGDPETSWISGDDVEQWIQLDLGRPVAVAMIRLIVAQYPAGPTVHTVWAGSSGDDLVRVHVLEGITTDGDVLELAAPDELGPIRVVRVVTTTSPSWVAWREIEVVPRP
jgi:predicted amidohydrolase YtcJ